MICNRSRSIISTKSPRPRHGIVWRVLLSILALFSLMALVVGGKLIERLNSPASAAEQQQGAGNSEGLSQTALQQIQSLIEEKRSRTHKQRKIDSQLLFAMKMRRGQRVAA